MDEEGGDCGGGKLSVPRGLAGQVLLQQYTAQEAGSSTKVAFNNPVKVSQDSFIILSVHV